MYEEGLEPNDITFVCLLLVCRLGCWWMKAHRSNGHNLYDFCKIRTLFCMMDLVGDIGV